MSVGLERARESAVLVKSGKRSSLYSVPDVLSIALAFLVVTSLALWASPMFATNDDTGLAMVGAGFGLAVQPEPHLVFSHYGYGLLLSALSRVFGNNAHGIASLFAVGLSIALFARAVTGSKVDNWLLVSLILIAALGCVFLNAILRPQFTITAGVLFASAAACRLRTAQDGTSSLLLKVLIFCALILSFLIRPSSVVAVVLTAGPAFFWLAWRGEEKTRLPIRLFCVTVLILATLCYVTDWAGYRFSPEWRDALTYNQLRSLFNDFGRVPWIEGSPEYAKVGWSANDYVMFVNWYTNHPIFSIENIAYLVKSLALKSDLLKPGIILDWLVEPMQSPILSLMIVGQMVLCILLRKEQPLALLLLLGGLMAIVASGITGRPPQLRVWFTIASVGLLCMLVLLAHESRGRLYAKVRTAFIAILALIGIGAAAQVFAEHRAVVQAAAQYRSDLSNAEGFLRGKVISWGAALMWEWLITPTRTYPPVDGRTIPSIGALSRTPIMTASLERLGIEDLGKTLCKDPDVSLLADEEIIKMVVSFCRQHYGLDVDFEQVFTAARTTIFVPVKSNPRLPG